MFGERHVNVKGVQAYIEAAENGLPRLDIEAVTNNEAMEDFMMVGLRLLEGVSQKQFELQFQKQLDTVFQKPLQDLLAKCLLIKTNEGYCLSEVGVTLGNVVFGAFVGSLDE
jgi:oxygen-independent coproporphyrinogen-3 oxidase